jgi:hypothetical protein
VAERVPPSDGITPQDAERKSRPLCQEHFS